MNTPMSFPTPKTAKSSIRRDLVPMTIMIVRTVQGQRLLRLLQVLFDSGSTGTLIHSRCLPPGAVPALSANKRVTTTASGSFDTSRSVFLKDIRLPEFTTHSVIDGVEARVFDADSRFDLILGRDFLTNAGLDVCFSDNTVKWLGRSIDLKPNDYFNSTTYFNDINKVSSRIDADSEYEGDIPDIGHECFAASPILERKYQKVTAKEVASKQEHLSDSERRKMEAMLSNYEEVFDGKLGCYPHQKVHLELINGAQPFCKKAYSVAHANEKLFKDELDNLCKDGVLEKCGPSEWGSPTFITKKKDGRVRWVSDFRELNRLLKRRQYPLPKIHDIMRKRRGYKYFTKIDLSMMFYCFMLDDDSMDMCTIVTPYGKYRYRRLPMGIKVSPDYAQAIIEKVLDGLDVDCYIDDMGLWTDGTFEEHLSMVSKILERLQDNGLKCNPLKCDWAVQESDFLGYWMTPEGVKPKRDKIEAVLKLGRPRNQMQVRSFLGAVTFYKSMFPRRSHVLRPLTELTGKGAFEWLPRHQKAFDEMKAIIAAEAINVYADPNLHSKFTQTQATIKWGQQSCKMASASHIGVVPSLQHKRITILWRKSYSRLLCA